MTLQKLEANLQWPLHTARLEPALCDRRDARMAADATVLEYTHNAGIGLQLNEQGVCAWQICGDLTKAVGQEELPDSPMGLGQ